MEIKFNAVPRPEARKDKTGEVKTDNVPLLIDVTYNGNRFFLNSGFTINATFWDKAAKRLSPNSTHPKELKGKKINDAITDLLSKIKNTFKKFETLNQTPTVSQFKDALLDKPEYSNEEIPFFKSFDLYVLQGIDKWQPNTVKKHNTTKSHLLAYDKKLSFEKLEDPTIIDGFVKYLNKEGLRNTSAEKYLKVLKWFLIWAADNKHTKYNKFLNYKPSLENIDKEVIFLTQQEFITLYELDIKQPYLDRVRDVYCFSCVTSLRYSDILNLKRSQIKNGVIHLTTVKTNQKLTIPLNKYSKAILDKYCNDDFGNDKALPVISNQKSNEYLKKVCEMAGFNEIIAISYKVGNKRKDEFYPKYSLMSMHSGRRTFVCLGLFLGLAVKSIMSFTGHKSIAAMKPYEKIVDELKNLEMDKFNF